MFGGGETNVDINPQSLSLENHFFDKGATSRVYKGTFTDINGQIHTVCAKEFLVSLRGRYKLKIKSEVEILVTLTHPNVLLHYGLDFQRSLLVTEYVEKIIEFEGSEERIHNTRQLLDIKENGVPWGLRINIAMQAADGLFYLHSRGVVHADIKAGNVFLGGGKETDRWIVKLGDFGESLFKFMQYSSTQVSSLQGTPSKKGMRRATTAFLAPERADPCQKPTKASDIYAFAIFLVELTLPQRIHPFDGDLPPNYVIVEAATRGIRPSLPERITGLDDVTYKLWFACISKAWVEDPLHRPNIKDVFEEIKKICIKTDTAIENNIAKENSSQNLPRYQCPDKVIPLEVHQGSALEAVSEMVADSLQKTGKIPPNLQAEATEKVQTEDGTNACVFLSLLILHKVKNIDNANEMIDFQQIKKIAEDEIKTAPKIINSFRDIGKFMAVDEAQSLLKCYTNILPLEYILEEKLLGLQPENESISERAAALEIALQQLSENAPKFAIYTQTPISFSILAQKNQLIIVDTHQIHRSVGGNGNGAVIVFSRNANQSEKESFFKRASIWILHRISTSVKLGSQSLVVLEDACSSTLPPLKQRDLKDDGFMEENIVEVNSLEWEDDDMFLELVSQAEDSFVSTETDEKKRDFLSDKFLEIPTSAIDVTLQGHATKLGIMNLKDFQLRAVKAVLEGRDCLIVQSTSSGKSICFQLPAIILQEGHFVLVISPTVSLMESQVHSLKKLGVDAVFLGSASFSDWNFAKLDDIHTIEEDKIPKIVYVTPEYLIGDDKRPGAYLKLPSERIGLIVVDECHKIFERSGNFR